MSRAALSRIARGFAAAAHAGFPWPGPAAEGQSPELRRALRRSVLGHWPASLRWPAAALMTLLWPVESLRDAVSLSRLADARALCGRSRIGLALWAWSSALRHNLPPVDYLAYRLFEEGRPGPGCWLHSADAHLHFAALASPDARELVRDKLAFADLAESCGAPVMPVLAAYGPDGPAREFAGGEPPPLDLVVKPRRGHGTQGLVFWRWDGGRHVAIGGDPDPVRGPAFLDWLSVAATNTDLIVQEFAAPPDTMGRMHPSEAPALSILTAEGPDRHRVVAFALVIVVVNLQLELALPLEVDPATGRVDGLSPGAVQPIWPIPNPLPEPGPFEIADWAELLAAIDRVHAALPGPAPVLKWDVILTEHGPRLLEANAGPGVHVFQAATLRPLTETPIGAVLEAWAR